MKINFRSIVYLVFFILISLSTASLMFGKPVAQSLRTIKAGKVYFKVPKDLPQEISTGDTVSGSLYIGEMDDRELSYIYFLKIYWSKSRIENSILIPKSEYSKQSEKSLQSHLVLDPNTLIIDTYLSIKKPCGKVINEDLNTVKFYDKKTGMFLAVSGFVRPVLSRDDLLVIAKSLQYQCD